MTTENIIATVRSELIRSIAALDEWFDSEQSLMEFQPSAGKCVCELLRHVMLTNQFLLALIEEECKITKDNGSGFDLSLPGYCLEMSREDIDDEGPFTRWASDVLMPSADRPLDEVRREIREQLNTSLIFLEMLKGGEGTLYRICLPVDGTRNLDVYQSLYFLARYTGKNVGRLQSILEEYNREFNAVG